MNFTCLLCGKKKFQKMFTFDKYSVVRCSNCRLFSTLPIPTKKELEVFYKSFSFNDGFSFEKRLRYDARRSLKNLDSLGYNSGSLLDIGCGAGFFMDEARKKGWETTGVDTAKIPVDYAVKKLKLNAVQKNILAYKTTRKFDVISLQQVIEHLPDPYPVLSNMQKLLARNGIVCISTPNIDSWLYRVLGKRFNYFIPPEHLVYYSPSTLSAVLKKAGFRVKKTTTYGYPMDLGGIYRALREGKKDKENILPPKNTIKQKNGKVNQSLKHIIFENYICNYGYTFLNLFNKGSMIEIYAEAK